MQYDTKTVYLSNAYPRGGINSSGIYFNVAGKTKVIFDLSNIDKGLANGLGITKTYVNFGDGNVKYYESVFNLASEIFLPPAIIEHTYVVTTTADKLDGVIDFFYSNGYTSRIELSTYVAQTNLIDIGLQNTENQLFNAGGMKKVITFTTKNNDLYNCAIVPTLLNEYNREARSVIPKQIDRNVYIQTSRRGDQINVLSATDVLATDVTPTNANFGFLVY
tara:strand:+ start:2724 stop:3383 length:660 start_codon:yes stop_codon:yes gene_type:complete